MTMMNLQGGSLMPNETIAEPAWPHVALSGLILTALEPLLPPREAPISYLRLELIVDAPGSVRWCEARTVEDEAGMGVPHHDEQMIQGYHEEGRWYDALADVVQLPPMIQRMVLTIEANRLPQLETTVRLREVAPRKG